MLNIAIIGYGNLGRGVEAALSHCSDMQLCAVFTRRPPESVQIHSESVPVLPYAQLLDWKDRLDLVILCGGSATDLPEMTPEVASHFHVVDSFDTHAKIPAHFAKVDAAARAGGKLAVISAGWDPGLFSVNRVYASAVLPEGRDDTFWGTGVSQGHSDAIRRIPGVLDARQYTIPVPAAIERVRAGENPVLSTREKHTRACYVVAAPEADLAAIESAIVSMPNYFADYDTSVQFITEAELRTAHSGLPHGGSVIRSGVTGFDGEHKHSIEYALRLDSNPEFTASVLVACARAALRLAGEGARGCKTIFDLPPAALSPFSGEELRASML